MMRPWDLAACIALAFILAALWTIWSPVATLVAAVAVICLAASDSLGEEAKSDGE